MAAAKHEQDEARASNRHSWSLLYFLNLVSREQRLLGSDSHSVFALPRKKELQASRRASLSTHHETSRALNVGRSHARMRRHVRAPVRAWCAGTLRHSRLESAQSTVVQFASKPWPSHLL
ncbi:hypothetical protein MRX96_036424 [Rhipicephalus microplus]